MTTNIQFLPIINTNSSRNKKNYLFKIKYLFYWVWLQAVEDASTVLKTLPPLPIVQHSYVSLSGIGCGHPKTEMRTLQSIWHLKLDVRNHFLITANPDFKNWKSAFQFYYNLNFSHTLSHSTEVWTYACGRLHSIYFYWPWNLKKI